MRLASALLAGLLAASPALAQPMPGMQQTAPPASGEAPSTSAYKQAMQTMNADMNVEYTGNPDRDFVAVMIPHHQGAMDMARVELHYGNDPELRRLARQIVASQQKEIALMRRWQAKHGEKHAR